MRHDLRDSTKGGCGPSGTRTRRRSCVLGLAFLTLVIAENMAAESTAPKSATLETNLRALRSSAAKYGSVRAIVSVASVAHGVDITAEIEVAKKQLIGRLRGPDAPTVESIEGTPYVIMVLTPSGVE